ncbi:MAG: glycosyltransferase [Pseudomonadota bacterium]
MSSRWPIVPHGALAAAMVASRKHYWSDAILLWQDIFRHGDHDELAAGCLAEAALRTGDQGLADHMLGQFTTPPSFLGHVSQDDSVETSPSLADWTAAPLEEVAAFRETHPLGGQTSEISTEAIPLAPSRPSALARLTAPRPDAVRQAVEIHGAREDDRALRDYAATLIARRARPAALHWAILGCGKQDIGAGDRTYDALLSAFAAYPLSPVERARADARLYRAFGYPAFARLLLLDAMTLADRAADRAKIRHRLAVLAIDRDRWLDDSEILSTADFGRETPERDALLSLARSANRLQPMRPSPSPPLESAFAWLLGPGLDEVERYAPENRLLMVGNTLGCGGMERMLARAYRHFSDADVFDTVDLALLDYADVAPSAFYAGEAGVRADDILLLDRNGASDMPCSLLPGSWKARAQKLFDHIRATRPRIIHAWNDLTGLLSAYAGLAAGCPKIIVHFHHAPDVPQSGRAEQISSYPAVYRRLRERTDIATVFCAEAAARGYARWWRVAEDERFRVLYNGFDWDIPAIGNAQAKHAIGLAKNRPVVGTVLRFSEVKQPLLWAEAAITLAGNAPDTQFLMVGDGPFRSAVANRFAEAGLADSLHMPGQVGNVPDHLAAMDLFWLTSRTEGLPNVLIEAQFSGVPIAAFDVGGIGETFIDGETGLLVPQGDIVALVERSRTVLGDADWRNNACRKARIQAEERFSAQTFFDGLRSLYGA